MIRASVNYVVQAPVTASSRDLLRVGGYDTIRYYNQPYDSLLTEEVR